MNILITLVIIVAVLIALVLIVAFFTKKAYRVEREIVINKPKPSVFNYIKYLKNQDYYSKWILMDPGMKKEYKGTDGTVGFVSSWDSNDKKVGKGEQEIKQIIDNEKFNSEIHFIKPFEGRANASMTTIALSADQTKVSWGFTSKMNYPMNIMLLFMSMDKMIGTDLEIGLANLKGVLEK